MKKIIAMGPNPAWQKSLFFKEFQPGEVNRAECMDAYAAGQGSRVDLGAARNTSKSVRDACHSHAVKLIFVPEGRLGAAIGKPGRMAAATADEGFAKRLDELYGVQNTIGGA